MLSLAWRWNEGTKHSTKTPYRVSIMQPSGDLPLDGPKPGNAEGTVLELVQ